MARRHYLKSHKSLQPRLCQVSHVVYLFTFQSLSESQDQTKDKTSRKKAQSANAAAKVFSRYDVVETSYHFYSDRIDLHLCDDPGGSKLIFLTIQGRR